VCVCVYTYACYNFNF